MSENLKVGDNINRVMVLTKKVKRDFSNGKFFLLQFSDKDGTLKGVWWDPSREGERIRVDDVVRVTGEIQDYQGALQVRVNYMEALADDQYDPAVFLPSSSRDVNAIYDELLGMIEKISDGNLRTLLGSIFGGDGFRDRFLRSPAAKGWHHAYVGGLAEHVYDMARMALSVAGIYPEADSDLLLAGVLLHDIGKMSELSVTNHIDYSDQGRLIGHISMGVAILDEYLRGMENFPPELEMKLKHMILSHHGQLQHGSPVVPMTVEALLLNYIDNMDAQVRGTLMVLEKSGGDSLWTDYVRLLDRFIYKGEMPQDLSGEEDVSEDE